MPSTKESNTIRFAVGTSQNPQSHSWKMWVQGDDVYLGARSTLFAWKVSLHKSGIWRIAKVADLDRDDGTTDRLIFRWNRPGKFAPGWTQSVGVLVSALQPSRPFPSEQLDAARVTWFPPPNEGLKLLFKVMFSTPDYSDDQLRLLFGQDQIAARMVKKNGEVVWLVVREDPLTSIEMEKIHDVMANTKIHLAQGSSEDAVIASRAMLLVTEEPPSQPTLIDIPLGRENLEIA